jgi:hypothetical protein
LTGGLATNQFVALAPNNNYPTTTSAASTPMSFTNSTASPLNVNLLGELNMENTNIYYGTNAGSGLVVSVYGWTDKVNAT